MPDDVFRGRNGWSWHAHAPGGEHLDEVEERAEIEGTSIRMMPEYGVVLPLWDDGGPFDEEDRGLLRRELGLSDELLDSLKTWQAEWDDVSSAAVSDDTVPVKPLPSGWAADHAARGRALFVRLEDEIDPRFDVRLHL